MSKEKNKPKVRSSRPLNHQVKNIHDNPHYPTFEYQTIWNQQ